MQLDALGQIMELEVRCVFTPSPVPKKPQKKARKGHSFHLKRATGQLRTVDGPLGSKPITAMIRVMLNDFKPYEVDFFSNVKLPQGEMAALTMEAPARFFQKGKVMRCEEAIPSSKIVTDTAFKYRLTLKFQFESPEQESTVKAFVMAIRNEHLKVDAAA